ncbi:MAG TPA: biotin/lipoyl-binding protein [Melioribacteraceae bacterium]|nr:biotin/lipoyl-binding protein [Melioribacteraceae bacterium]
MKKYKFTIQGNNYDVEIKNIEDNIAEVDVNGSVYKVQIHQEIKQSKTPRLVRSVAVPTGESAEAKTAKPNERKGGGVIKAPLPGVILEVKVREGDVVKIGDTLMIMEAMKMENNIKADKEGKIISLKAKQGDSVLEGDVLVEIGS